MARIVQADFVFNFTLEIDRERKRALPVGPPLRRGGNALANLSPRYRLQGSKPH